jgi:tetratricopeptide (TPR) repeat protein
MKAPQKQAFATAATNLKAGNFTQAEEIFSELVQENPEQLQFHEALLESLFCQGKLEEVTAHFRQILERFDPTGDADYHAIYVNALAATANRPLPLKRLLRFYELIQQLCSTLPGDSEVAECGCFRGMSSFLICSYLRKQNPAFTGQGYHIFDSFKGLAAPTTNDEVPAGHPGAKLLQTMSHAGSFCASLSTVRDNLAQFAEIEFHPGWIPATFQGLPEMRYSFVHIDVDMYEPTAGSLDYFYPRLASGGKIVSDDYSWPGAKKAIDEFCTKRGIEPVITQYHQAVIPAV